MEFLQDIGLDTKSGKGYTGSEEKYMAALQRFYRSYEKNKKKVEEYLAAEDYESYMITVHALKSNAKMIGARDLSTLFETLEMAVNQAGICDVSAIYQHCFAITKHKCRICLTNI